MYTVPGHEYLKRIELLCLLYLNNLLGFSSYIIFKNLGDTMVTTTGRQHANEQKVEKEKTKPGNRQTLIGSVMCRTIH